jgi:hypothetical protein
MVGDELPEAGVEIVPDYAGIPRFVIAIVLAAEALAS